MGVGLTASDSAATRNGKTRAAGSTRDPLWPSRYSATSNAIRPATVSTRNPRSDSRVAAAIVTAAAAGCVHSAPSGSVVSRATSARISSRKDREGVADADLAVALVSAPTTANPARAALARKGSYRAMAIRRPPARRPCPSLTRLTLFAALTQLIQTFSLLRRDLASPWPSISMSLLRGSRGPVSPVPAAAKTAPPRDDRTRTRSLVCLAWKQRSK